MKTKYMSRKFIVSLAGLVVSCIALACDNTLVALGGLALAGCFVIGESIVDAHSCVKQHMSVDKRVYTNAQPVKEYEDGKAET